MADAREHPYQIQIAEPMMEDDEVQQEIAHLNLNDGDRVRIQQNQIDLQVRDPAGMQVQNHANVQPVQQANLQLNGRADVQLNNQPGAQAAIQGQERAGVQMGDQPMIGARAGIQLDEQIGGQLDHHADVQFAGQVRINRQADVLANDQFGNQAGMQNGRQLAQRQVDVQPGRRGAQFGHGARMQAYRRDAVQPGQQVGLRPAGAGQEDGIIFQERRPLEQQQPGNNGRFYPRGTRGGNPERKEFYRNKFNPYHRNLENFSVMLAKMVTSMNRETASEMQQQRRRQRAEQENRAQPNDTDEDELL